MSEQTFEAESVEAALTKAAAALGVDAAELEHEVVEKKQDFWGAGDTFVIRAWQPAAEEDQAEAPTPEPSAEDDAGTEEEPPGAPAEQQQTAEAAEAGPTAEEAEEEAPTAEASSDDEGSPTAEASSDDEESPTAKASSDDDESPTAEASSDDDEESPGTPSEQPRQRKAAESDGPEPAFDPNAEGDVEPDQVGALLAQIFHDMEFDCTVEVEQDDDGFSATVSGPDKEELLEGNGRCLSALELLVNNAFRNRMSRGDKIRVDAGNFRSRRDQELTDLAYQVAHSAKESGTTQETQELNPYERRLVHLALAEDQAVTTKSRGSGFLKNVQVIPEKQGRGGRGRRR